MKHLGDITKISGHTAPIVDCIIGGSPCQDLSVAGKRAGLDGERSGLYIEQVRIVKEMRERDERNGRTDVDIRPRYMVWENVPGAFSSNKGDDFRIVLEELAKVKDKDKDAVIPMPDKWTNHGCIMGDGWSIAWRVLDAQFWGVPQRRRRIALVADFGGCSAPEILFVRKSVSGHTDEGKPKRKEASPDATGGIGADDCVGADIYNTALTVDKTCPLTAEGYTSTGTCPKVMTPVTVEPGIASREGGHIYEGVCGTLRANAGDNQMATVYPKSLGFHLLQDPIESEDKTPCMGTGNTKNGQASIGVVLESVVYENHSQDSRYKELGDICETVSAKYGTGGNNQPLVVSCDSVYCLQGNGIDRAATAGCNGRGWREGKSYTLDTVDRPAVIYALDRASFNQGKNAQYDFEVSDKGVNSPLVAKGPGAVCYWDGGQVAGTLTANNAGGNRRMPDKENFNCVIQGRTRYIVRRLTPLECERLQGYPDGWTDIGEWTDSNGKKRQTSDAARYKALGNSIALPPWKWVLKRLCACYERDATMASLFDGIGGFPYLWEQLNGKGTCLWASEIEEFPIAVTKVRIGV